MQRYLNILSQSIIAKVVKFLIFILVAIYLVLKIKDLWIKNKTYDLLGLIYENIFVVIIVFFLSVINWSLEALKWKVAVKNVEEVTFGRALVGVLSGLNISIFLPQYFGDYAGRIWNLNSENRAEAISDVMVCHFSQFLITLIAGILGFFSLHLMGFKMLFSNVFLQIFLSISIVLFLVVFYLCRRWIKKSLLVLNYYRYVKYLFETDKVVFLKVLLLSLSRYICFLLQFVLLLKVCGIKVAYLILVFAVMCVYLVKTLFVSFNLVADLGVREFSVDLVFQIIEPNNIHIGIYMASLLLWVINLLIPTIIGWLAISNIRVFSRNDES